MGVTASLTGRGGHGWVETFGCVRDNPLTEDFRFPKLDHGSPDDRDPRLSPSALSSAKKGFDVMLKSYSQEEEWTRALIRAMSNKLARQ
jgi:hypothetical protein